MTGCSGMLIISKSGSSVVVVVLRVVGLGVVVVVVDALVTGTKATGDLMGGGMLINSNSLSLPRTELDFHVVVRTTGAEVQGAFGQKT
jgi:hypothetical protein